MFDNPVFVVILLVVVAALGAAAGFFAGRSKGQEMARDAKTADLNEAKAQMIGVREATLEQHGAVSEPVVIEMAIGALKEARADYAISISGIAGPDGGSDVKPVGTVWFGFATSKGEGITRRECFSGDRESVRRQATEYALKTLWQQFLQNT